MARVGGGGLSLPIQRGSRETGPVTVVTESVTSRASQRYNGEKAASWQLARFLLQCDELVSMAFDLLPRDRRLKGWLLGASSLACAVWLAGCATALEQQVDRDLAATEGAAPGGEGRSTFDLGTNAPSPAERAASSSSPGPNPRATNDGSLDYYVRIALEQSPELAAEFEEWRAARHRIQVSRRLPEPVISYTYFVRQVETRVGPQQHRIGVTQSFPWPTRLTAAADAASYAAMSARSRYEAAALGVARQVAERYWGLWLIEKTREVQRDQERLLAQLSEAARVRLEVGQGSLADLSQINLSLARVSDELSGLDEARRKLRADLLATLGVDGSMETPIVASAPNLAVPAEDAKSLHASARDNPSTKALEASARAEQERAHAADAESMPTFTVGADYIVTGDARMPDVPDSGKDALLVMLAVQVPLWQSVYGTDADAARARSAALTARKSASQHALAAALEGALSDIDDSARRVRLYETTLLPQGEAALGSVLGGYQAGTASVAQVLMAQRDLLELELGRVRGQAAHAIAWARLEAIVGRSVRAKEAG